MSTPTELTCGSPGPFEVHGQPTTALVGEKQRLALWSNRLGADLHYEWRVLESPPGSLQLLAQATGNSNLSSPSTCEQAYHDGTVPHFVPDLPGHYVFEVRAVELTTGQVAIGHGTLDASAPRGSTEGAGCTTFPGWPLLLVGLLLLRRVR